MGGSIGAGEEKMNERTLVRCSLWSPTIVLDDEVIEPWSPDGCHEKEWVMIDDVKGWVWHGVFPLCPSCERLWINAYEDVPWM